MTTPAPPESGEDTDIGTERPDLRVVPEPAEHVEDVEPAEETAEADSDVVDVDAEPVLDTDGNPATPQAPVDVRLREMLIRSLHGIPAFGQSPASFAESIEYSQNGDWASSESTAKRAVHGLATILAYLITYLPVDVLGRARTKPGPFLVAVAIGVCLINVLALAA